MTLDHKTSLKCQFFKIKIYTWSESWRNKLPTGVWFVRIIGYYIWPRYIYLNIWNRREQKNQNIEKITFIKVVQIKFLALHITNQKLIWYIYSRKSTKYLQGTRSLLNILMIFSTKIIYNFGTYNVCLAIATNIHQRLKTGFVVQGHICSNYLIKKDGELLKWHLTWIIILHISVVSC